MSDTGTTMEIGDRRLELSSLDKVLFPDEGITKGDLIDYYRRVARPMLAHLRERPVSMHRFPDGIDGKEFFQKDTPDYFPDWIRTKVVEKEEGTVRHVVCDDVPTLVYLANQACITPHVWLSRVDRLHHPDRMIFDLDPSEGGALDPARKVREAARIVHDALSELGFTPFLMTTGSRGFHLWVPLVRQEELEVVRAFAHDLSQLLAARHPALLTVEHRKQKRGKRVFLDYLRNAYAQTAVTPYAVRARPGAPVATPLDWDELDGVDPRHYTIRNLFQRLGQKEDPWRAIDDHARPVGPAHKTLQEWLKEAVKEEG